MRVTSHTRRGDSPRLAHALEPADREGLGRRVQHDGRICLVFDGRQLRTEVADVKPGCLVLMALVGRAVGWTAGQGTGQTMT